MRTTARDRRRAIAFILGSLLLLAVVLGLLKGVSFLRTERIYYVLVPDSVSGLRAGSTVEYKGVSVGVVRSIAFRSGAVEVVEVEIAIRPGISIKLDTRARLRPQGITGLEILELVGGTTTAPDLPERGDVTLVPSILNVLEETVHDVAALAHRLNTTTAAIESQVAPTVADIREALEAWRDTARGVDASTAAIASQVALSSEAFRGTASDVRTILRDSAWQSLGPEVLAAVEDARRALARLERAASMAETVTAENRDDVRAAVESLRHASSDVRATARHVRESPASLVIEHPRREKPIPDELPPSERDHP
jgi:ABC-type transporter Mla subunit MlaD